MSLMKLMIRTFESNGLIIKRCLSSQSRSRYLNLTKGSRDRYIDVFKPTTQHGTLSRLDLPKAYDSLASHPDFGVLHQLSEEGPWFRHDGSAGLLQQNKYKSAVDESIPNLFDKILDEAEAAREDDEALARLAMLKNMYAHFINYYCYEPCRHQYAQTKDPNNVGVANWKVPRQLAQPRSLLCQLFDDETDLRWQNYNEYSPANCRVVDASKPLTSDNVTTMVRGEGDVDEIGFITNHYVQERKTTKLVAAAYRLADACPVNDIDELVSAMKMAHEGLADINSTNKEMPRWCKPEGYASLRTWIPGPKGHSGNNKLFPEHGVMLEGSDELGLSSYDMSRGETGAMTTIIALARIMSGFEYNENKFGKNELTSAQKDFDFRRETGQRRFLREIREHLGQRLLDQAKSHIELGYHLIVLRNEVITHNLTHYGYSRHYIFDNTKAGTRSLFEATGGTTHSFLPTSALANITDTLSLIEAVKDQQGELDAASAAHLDQIESDLCHSRDQTDKYRQRFLQLDIAQKSAV